MKTWIFGRDVGCVYIQRRHRLTSASAHAHQRRDGSTRNTRSTRRLILVFALAMNTAPYLPDETGIKTINIPLACSAHRHLLSSVDFDRIIPLDLMKSKMHKTCPNGFTLYSDR